MKSGTLFFFGTGILTLALAATSGLTGCQGGSTGTGASGTTSNTGGEGTTTGSNTGGTHTGSTSGSTTTTGTGGTGSSGMEVTIQDITTNKVGPDIPIKVSGVVAMSHKFLVSQSSTTGSCLWGVFLSAPGITTTDKNTGILAVSYGTQAMIPDGGSKAFCPVIQQGVPAGDGFPDDVKPGDVFDVTGKSAKFVLSSCGTKPGETTIAQYQISNVAPGGAVKKGTAPVPAPAVISETDLAKVAGQTDQAFLNEWGGVKVRIKDATPVLVTPMGGTAPGIVGDFGKITLMGSNAQVGDKIYYQGLLNSFMDPCHMGPHYADNNTVFSAIDGFVFLNFCTWDIEPENRCVDLQPPSDDCAGNLCP